MYSRKMCRPRRCGCDTIGPGICNGFPVRVPKREVMFICDESQTLIPARVKQGGRNASFRPGSAIGPEIQYESPERILKQDENVYM
jgi:hypothetical protein